MISGRLPRAARHSRDIALLRRACRAIMQSASPTPGPSEPACTITRQCPSSNRAQRSAVRQLPLLAAAPKGVTIRRVGLDKVVIEPQARATGTLEAHASLREKLEALRNSTLAVYAHLTPGQLQVPQL